MLPVKTGRSEPHLDDGQVVVVGGPVEGRVAVPVSGAHQSRIPLQQLADPLRETPLGRPQDLILRRVCRQHREHAAVTGMPRSGEGRQISFIKLSNTMCFGV